MLVAEQLNIEQLNLEGVVSLNWKDIKPEEGAPGITVRTLWQGGDNKRVCVYEFQPGSVFPGIDIHEPGPEQVFVISGDLSGDGNTYRAGDFIHFPEGTSHIPQSKDGCVLLVTFPEG
jgi:anti-sigma factor ChrR (cupin superfamily)|tara:strand:+ start:157 stop:510 length:354 start_codon:yes stop_codon:yes gene_type:complete